MSTILETVETFFTNDEWYFIKLEDQPILQMGFQGKSGKWTCFARIDEEHHIFRFYSTCPINIPEDKQLLITEYLTRANYGLKVGNFEMDHSDGEVRYKTSIDVENDELTPALVANLVYTNVWTMDRYLPGIYSVTYGDVSPQEAVEEIESS